MKRTPTGFEGTVTVPWGSKVLYKFRVDGNWITHENQPTEVDPIGNVNNVTYAPERPATHDIAAVQANGVIVLEKSNAVPSAAPIPLPKELETPATETPAAEAAAAKPPAAVVEKKVRIVNYAGREC